MRGGCIGVRSVGSGARLPGYMSWFFPFLPGACSSSSLCLSSLTGLIGDNQPCLTGGVVRAELLQVKHLAQWWALKFYGTLCLLCCMVASLQHDSLPAEVCCLKYRKLFILTIPDLYPDECPRESAARSWADRSSQGRYPRGGARLLRHTCYPLSTTCASPSPCLCPCCSHLLVCPVPGSFRPRGDSWLPLMG